MNQEGVLASCAVCNQQTQRRCGRCFSVYYCNTEHQRQDWKRHKINCAPKLQEQGSRIEKNIKSSIHKEEKKKETKKEQLITSSVVNNNKEVLQVGSETRRLKKSKKKTAKKEGSDTISDNKNISQIIENNNESTASVKVDLKDKSVFSSVVYSNKDVNKISAITYEGSSEQEILNEKAQQLSSVDFASASTSNVLKTINRADVKMPPVPIEQSTRMKEYPEASLKGSGAPFNTTMNSYFMDPSDPSYEICQRVIRDMTQYGVCVINNFLGKERGHLVLNEVLEMYRSGIFTAGQLVSSPGSTEAQTIRSDRITWIDGKEPQCHHIGQLISQVDSIILKANKMSNNGKMGNYIINGRTKAMVACYPGSGSHYVKHVDNPNKDGRCITAIYYLNLDWDVKRCGGLLRVFPEGTNQVADIAPIFDRMLFFWSDRRNPHEVQPAYSTRYAITLWYFDSQEREEALRNFSKFFLIK
ncbi:egl nine protein 1 [Danaus plexippus plexippus]|uniref:hypoxia-inducible factor-proline dioxygenase n=1 Tax=Danaus plexippus plexippus TaxID=278856 RepID=A0A212EZT4_DANPL|nr:egl nine protein 1 [Danaus plexippus plexippus]